ncbi:unnamed protein product [Ceutorhynchus assimilis]|uniref:DUF4802 domain-containing protein n=1 Tax=Ceutorhynchus assimilis TaxID=467358 RepID=A0A9P0DP20_9CUCU|nr:unnamed protein product [Ceutorhynchus assimilis]
MPTGKCYTADICSGYSLIDCIRKAMKGRIIDCSPHQDIYFLESHSAKNEESNLENLFVSPAGREMLKYKPHAKLKQQKTNLNLEFFTSNQNPTRQLQPDKGQETKSTTKIDLYEEAAAILGLSCTQTDDCRCIECQGHYFDFEEEIEFPVAGNGADYAGKLLKMDHASSCSIQ